MSWQTIRGAALGAALALTAGGAVAQTGGQTGEAAQIQAVLEAWLAERAPVEGVTGIAAYVSLGDPGPTIEAFAGVTGREPGDGPTDRDTLFHMGSTSKSFASAVILKLEAAGKLALDDTIGDWLPEYPAWADVNIRRLLSMSSGIPNYSETAEMSRIWVEEPTRDLTPEDLVAIVYPDGVDDLPVITGYHYSNTNFILAGMIAAKAGGAPYPDLVRSMVIDAEGLTSTFFDPGTYPADVVARMAHGYFENTACTDYQPKDCAVSWNEPIFGRDIRGDSLSWAQAAGGGVASARDVDTWVRDIFAGRVVPPEQQAEWMQLISQKTGEPIADVTPDDPRGFSLGLAKAVLGPYGGQWLYQGTTLGYRTLYVWFEDEDLLITVQTNSQPDDDENELNKVVIAIHDVLKAGGSI